MSEGSKPSEAPTNPAIPARKRTKAKCHGGVVASRIDHIEGLMRELKFVTGKTVKQLAKEWGLHKVTVAEYAGEASRRVRASVMDDKDHVSASVGVALERALQSAIREKQWRVVAQLADTWAKISGASAASRTELTGANGGPVATVDIGSLTDEQLQRLAAGDLAALASASGVGASPPATGGSGTPGAQ